MAFGASRYELSRLGSALVQSYLSAIDFVAVARSSQRYVAGVGPDAVLAFLLSEFLAYYYG